MLRWVVVLAALIVVALSVFGSPQLAHALDPDPAATPRPLADHPCGYAPATRPRVRHVIWIWMENHSYRQVIGADDAPFENHLARACGLAANYHAVAHPSLPNYLAATGGSTFGGHSDRVPRARPIRAHTIFSEVAASGRQWRTFVESMPGDCHRMDAHGFARNPAKSFTHSRRHCRHWDVPLGTPRSGALATALRTDRLPAFSLVIPSLCHSTHGCPVSNGDAWLSRWIDSIVTSTAYRPGHTALFLTWDEGNRALGQHIPLIVVSPFTAPGTISHRWTDHYSLLRTTTALLGLRPPGHAATAPSLGPAFGL